MMSKDFVVREVRTIQVKNEITALAKEVNAIYKQVAERFTILMRLRASKAGQERIDGVRRHHSQEFYRGIKGIGGFLNKT